MPEITHDEVAIALSPGDTCILFTDGLLEGPGAGADRRPRGPGRRPAGAGPGVAGRDARRADRPRPGRLDRAARRPRAARRARVGPLMPAGQTYTRPAMGRPVVILAGGTGGAKLARGMLDVVGDDLVVIANTGDDVEIYGAYVSPRPRSRARSGSPTASTSAAGACATTRSASWTGCASSASTSGSTSATATSRSVHRRAAPAPSGADARRRRSPSWRAALGVGARACCRCPTIRCARACSPAATGSRSRSS